MNDFYVWIEQDEDGVYVGEVPQLPACYTQGRTLDELLHNIREVIALCLEERRENAMPLPVFVGVQRVAV
ncbi:MAG TPA: type II toxin-antitoxin system HicB family antitoxin [Anaerolineae bacterium]|nr:type II toxin-antitoxin system HicB family antitoxin [Anaerolineae bacterium]HQI83890.1 type II toxin-antitoxin system HicB family antitoxin [Anaerolineae bacterium]